ncbi:hypothetical protein BG004_006448 [Podila humilis]|nr:hypothetical protein BG004_006448 [Podila humilis]
MSARADWPKHKVACVPGKVAPSPAISAGSSASKTAPKPAAATAAAKSTTASTTTAKSAAGAKVAVSLPDPSKPLNLKPAKFTAYNKPEPSKTCSDLKFTYKPSPEGVTENLVLFFHGLGDKMEPTFTRLADSMQLPQSAVCCVEAPTPVPYINDPGFQWYPSFNNYTGELLGPDAPERIRQVKQKIRPNLVSLIRHFVEKCGFESRKIFLFGFSQGGEMALDLAAFGGIPLGGVISIGGYLMDEVQNDAAVLKTMSTKVLILQGNKDDSRPMSVCKDKFKYIQRIFGARNCSLKIVEGMGFGMPNNEAGWKPLMEFFSSNLSCILPGMESQSGLYEVSQGSSGNKTFNEIFFKTRNVVMMIKEPISTEDGSAPQFEQTLVVAFPDVAMAGPRILLSSLAQSTKANQHSIAAWSQYCSPPASRKNKHKHKISSRTDSKIPQIVYSTSGASTNLGLLTVTVAPPTTEQATNLCAAIVNHAQKSGTRHIIILAASRFAADPETHAVLLNDAPQVAFKAVKDNVSFGDHILNTLMTMLTFSNVPTTILMHPAKKGVSLRDTKAVIEHLTDALSTVVGSTNAHLFSSSQAIAFDSFQRDEEEVVESMMYL